MVPRGAHVLSPQHPSLFGCRLLIDVCGPAMLQPIPIPTFETQNDRPFDL